MAMFKLKQQLFLVCHGHDYYYMEKPDADAIKHDNAFSFSPMTVIAKNDLKEHVSCFDEHQNIVPNGQVLADYIKGDNNTCFL